MSPSATSEEAVGAAPKARRIALLFASQTGNAESIAQHISHEAVERGFCATEATVFDSLINATSTADSAAAVEALLSDAVLVIVTSTTGDGDPPDNATKFWRWLRRAKKSELAVFSGIRFTVLGLGDTNYTNFCQMAKRVDRKMVELGGVPFYKRGLADDGTGLEQVVDPWVEGLWSALAENVECDNAKASEFARKAAEKKLAQDSVAIALKVCPESRDQDPGDSLDDIDEHNRPARISLPFQDSDLPDLEQLKVSAAAIPPESQVSLKPTGESRNFDEESVFEVLRSSSDEFNADRPYPAALLGSRILTGPAALKRVVEISLDISGFSESWDFRPGDAIGIIAPNPGQIVDLLIKRLDIQDPDGICNFNVSAASHPLSSICPATPREILAFLLDLRAPPRKPLLRFLAEHATDATEKCSLLALTTPAHFKSLKSRHPATTTFLDLLATFKSVVSLPLADLCDLLPRLQARWYSISRKLGNSVSVAFNITDYVEPQSGRRVLGHCTPWLESLKAGALVPVFPKPTSSFRLVPLNTAPVVCIAAGTGITPFMPLLESRAKGSVGLTWVIHGRRFAGDDDFVYGEDLGRLQNAGGVSRLMECLSREKSAQWKYVQDAVSGLSDDLWRLMTEENASIFVCGSVDMAKDVHKALLNMATARGGMALDEAKAFWNEAMRDGRYLKDVWG